MALLTLSLSLSAQSFAGALHITSKMSGLKQAGEGLSSVLFFNFVYMLLYLVL